MTIAAPQKKKPSGAQNRKRKRERERAEHEARLNLLRVQGKLTDVPRDKIAWTPRPHQQQLEAAHTRGIRRQAHVWHRRAGKSAACLDFLVRRAMERPGNYWYMCPKYSHVRTAIWESRRADGLREIDVHIPSDIRESTNRNEMSVTLINGSQIRFVGSDAFDKLVGANVAGLIFDEYALADPGAWDYLSPILAADPEAWALFISTYRGQNHWFRMVHRIKDDPLWHTSCLTVDDTFREDGTPIITPAILDQERKEGKSEAHIKQEYYCSAAAQEGAFYGSAMDAMQGSGRIGAYPYDSSLPVTCSVDLGFSDLLVFTFWQTCGSEERIIGTRAWKFTDITDAIDDCKRVFPWGNRPWTVVLPHDGRFGTAALFEPYGHEVVVLPRTGIVGREIQQVRAFLARVHIDNAIRPYSDNEENNARLVEALNGYRATKHVDDDGKQGVTHSWESHYADAVRYYVVYRETNETGNAWGPAPNYEQADRIARVVA